MVLPVRGGVLVVVSALPPLDVQVPERLVGRVLDRGDGHHRAVTLIITDVIKALTFRHCLYLDGLESLHPDGEEVEVVVDVDREGGLFGAIDLFLARVQGDEHSERLARTLGLVHLKEIVVHF